MLVVAIRARDELRDSSEHLIRRFPPRLAESRLWVVEKAGISFLQQVAAFFQDDKRII
jgi:hypothetical protein